MPELHPSVNEDGNWKYWCGFCSRFTRREEPIFARNDGIHHLLICEPCSHHHVLADFEERMRTQMVQPTPELVKLLGDNFWELL